MCIRSELIHQTNDEGVRHGTLSFVVAARRADSDSGPDLRLRRIALKPAIPGYETTNKKRRPDRAAFSVSFRWHHQPPLPPITARTVSSGPKSSAPST